MTEPRRWIDPDSDAAEHERDALRSGLDVSVPAAAPDLIWQRVLLAVAPTAASNGGDAGPGSPGSAAAGGGPAGAAAGSAGLAMGVAKFVLVGASAGFLMVGTTLVVSPNPKPRSAPTAASACVNATEVAGARAAGAPELVPLTRENTRPQPSPASTQERANQDGAVESAQRSAERASESSLSGGSAPPSAASAALGTPSELKAETDLIREARARLREGELERAKALLESAELRFRAPVLVEEREALTIELLRRSGRTELARARARDFLKRFPGSAHAAELAERLERFSVSP